MLLLVEPLALGFMCRSFGQRDILNVTHAAVTGGYSPDYIPYGALSMHRATNGGIAHVGR
jgi:hypothetical protein